MRRHELRLALVIVFIAALAACGTSSSSAEGTRPHSGTTHTSNHATETSRTHALQISQAMAINPATGKTDLTKPSVIRLLTYQDALAAMGTDTSNPVRPTHQVWLVH